MKADWTVLVVEDDEDDFFLTRRVLRRHMTGTIAHVESVSAAIDYLSGHGPFSDRVKYPAPDLVLLDLKLEQGTGHDVLAALGTCGVSPLPRVFVLTGSNEPRDRDLVKKSGLAAGYIVKPLASEHVTRILANAATP